MVDLHETIAATPEDRLVASAIVTAERRLSQPAVFVSDAHHAVQAVARHRLAHDATPVWMIHAAVPGLNIPFYVRAPQRPTHDEINAVWMARGDGRDDPLKDPATLEGARLRDCYPSYSSVERIEIAQVAA